MLKVLESKRGASSLEPIFDKIAAALGCPVSAFSEPASGALSKTDELLRLWFMIENEQDHAKVLAFVRTLAFP